jgi:hypothetical protein
VGILERELSQGCRLIEIPDLGHTSPDSIAEGLDFLDAPRGRKSEVSNSPAKASATSMLQPIKAEMKSSPAKAQRLFTQLWENHPELRENQDVLDVLSQLETLS